MPGTYHRVRKDTEPYDLRDVLQIAAPSQNGQNGTKGRSEQDVILAAVNTTIKSFAANFQEIVKNDTTPNKIQSKTVGLALFAGLVAGGVGGTVAGLLIWRDHAASGNQALTETLDTKSSSRRPSCLAQSAS